MAVMAREAWTDERMDDLKENVNQRFDDLDKRFDQVDRRFEKVEGEVKAGFAEIHTRFDSMKQTIIICFSGMTVSIVASVFGAVLLS